MRWTEKEIQFLKDNKGRLNNVEISEVLGRGDNSSIAAIMRYHEIRRNKETLKKFQAENGRRQGLKSGRKPEFKAVPCELYPELGHCIICTSHKVNTYGYPVIYRNGKLYKMKNYLWEEKYGKIPEGLYLLHKCDDPQCVKLEHLFLGTKADNAADRDRKGRQYRKLTGKQVIEIFNSGETQKILGRKYNVHQVTISCIKTGKSYKDVIEGMKVA